MIKRLMFILLLSLPAVCTFGQQRLYDLSFKDIRDQEVSMQSFYGKKLVIAVIDAAHPDERFLRELDTLYHNNSGALGVIVIPVSDFGATVGNDSLAAIYKRLHPGYILSRTGEGKKADGGRQHHLLYWVTHTSSNARFDNDVEEPGQLFVISETGVLYAVMKSKISPTGATMKKVISRTIKRS